MLIVEQLTIENSHHRLLNNANFTVKRGECLAIIGASGSGKSILANALLGALPQGFRQQGTVKFKIADKNSIEINSIAIVAQAATTLNPSTCVGSQILQQANSSKNTPAQLAITLQQASLEPDILTLYPDQLSGGMAKRVLTAMALIQNTDFIIADEPTCGLELSRSNKVFSELAALCQSDNIHPAKGVIIISHDLPGIVQVAHRILVLKDGHIVDNTTPAAIRQGIANAYTQALWDASPANWTRNCNAKAS